MEQIRKIAKTINRYFGVIKFITIALTILVTLAFLWILFALNETILLNSILSSFSLSWLSIQFDSSLFSSIMSMKLFLILTLIMVYIDVLMFIQLIKIIRNILNIMIEETIFKNEMANQLMDLCQLSFFYGAYTNFSSFIIYRFYLDHSNLMTLLDSGNISSASASFVFDFNFIIISGIIYLLAYVFKYGAELQQLSDETL